LNRFSELNNLSSGRAHDSAWPIFKEDTKMKFIPVTHKIPLNSIYSAMLSSVIAQTGVGLFSLIEAFKQTRFGLDTLYNLRMYQKEFRKEIFTPFNAKEYIDSGGYSFIKGQIHPDDIRKLIGCYLHYMIEEMRNYHRIFSLDLPISLKYNLYNTKENVRYFNRVSLLETFNVIDQIPELAEKFIFIWQFRTHDLYRIWCELHDELIALGYGKYIKNRAIGGMVGIKGMTGIRFAPFIALAYRCFKDYVEAGMFQIPFRLHLLGIYTVPDRFTIAYLERVFDRYLALESVHSGAGFTYDSINYEQQANYLSRELQTCAFINGKLDIFPDISRVPDHILRQVYYNDDLYHHALDEIQRIRQNKKLAFVGSFLPMSLYAFNSMDRFMEHVIEQYGLVDILFKSTSYISYIQDIEKALDQLFKDDPKVFGKGFKATTMDNVVKLYRLHQWWTKEGQKYETLDPIIHEFISVIGAPGKLL
jgi:hypothetical protein